MMGEFILMYTFASIVVAIGAFVFSEILTPPGEVFGWLYGFLDLIFKNDRREREGNPQHPMFKALIGCFKCVAGQWAMWAYLIYSWNLYAEGCWILILPHIGFVLLSIFFALIVKKLYTKYIQ